MFFTLRSSERMEKNMDRFRIDCKGQINSYMLIQYGAFLEKREMIKI